MNHPDKQCSEYKIQIKPPPIKKYIYELAPGDIFKYYYDSKIIYLFCVTDMGEPYFISLNDSRTNFVLYDLKDKMNLEIVYLGTLEVSK